MENGLICRRILSRLSQARQTPTNTLEPTVTLAIVLIVKQENILRMNIIPGLLVVIIPQVFRRYM